MSGISSNEDCCINLSETNKYLKGMNSDYLYHLELGTHTHDLQKLFGDVKFVCMGGTNKRMEEFAQYIKKEFGFSTIENYTTKRFAFFKIGPILSVSHGMGMPSFSILLHEMIKLMYHAKCRDPIFIRIGTCGGIGVTPGTVVVTKDAFNGLIKNVHEFVILGKKIEREAKFNEDLAKEIVSRGNSKTDDFEVIIANTMATDDFYEGQGRVDGAVCYHTEDEKLSFLKELHSKGVRNIEMEATVFAALTNITGIKAADVCVALIDRLNGDQVTVPKEKIAEMELRPQVIVGRFIKKRLFK